MFAYALKFDPAQPRDAQGQWMSFGATMAHYKATYPTVATQFPRSTHTEMGSIESHTTDVGREWALQLSATELRGISERFGSDVERLMTAAIPLHDIGKAEAIESGAGKHTQHEHTIPIMQQVLRQEGFSEKDVSLATELLNHDLIGPLFRWRSNVDEVVTALKDKAAKVGMPVSDFVTLQLAFYQADASAYPYITQFMTQEPSGQWHFKGRKQIAAIEALTQKRDYAREPAGSSHGGEFARTGGQFNPTEKASWYRYTDHWHGTPEGQRPYGWTSPSKDYTPPPVTHQRLRMKGIGTWGGSHQGSSAMTGEAAKVMGIPGWRELDPPKEAKAVVARMLEAIHADAAGSEEPLYHSFQNVAKTVFKPGDTMDLPLVAAAGQAETGYATRMNQEDQSGAPTVFAFPKGTPMVAYGMWPIKPTDRGYEDGNAKEFGYVYSEAIVAGRFRVVKVETVYIGSQHKANGIKQGELTPQLYGQVVHLEPIGTFNPATGQWEDHG